MPASANVVLASALLFRTSEFASRPTQNTGFSKHEHNDTGCRVQLKIPPFAVISFHPLSSSLKQLAAFSAGTILRLRSNTSFVSVKMQMLQRGDSRIPRFCFVVIWSVFFRRTHPSNGFFSLCFLSPFLLYFSVTIFRIWLERFEVWINSFG